jgi:hypothetical protein
MFKRRAPIRNAIACNLADLARIYLRLSVSFLRRSCMIRGFGKISTRRNEPATLADDATALGSF